MNKQILFPPFRAHFLDNVMSGEPTIVELKELAQYQTLIYARVLYLERGDVFCTIVWEVYTKAAPFTPQYWLTLFQASPFKGEEMCVYTSYDYKPIMYKEV